MKIVANKDLVTPTDRQNDMISIKQEFYRCLHKVTTTLNIVL